MSTYQKWTSERVEQLRAYVAAGLTCGQIALEIGVTRNAVIGRSIASACRRAVPSPRPRSDNRNAFARP